MLVAIRDVLDDRGLARDVALADVQEHEHRLLGEEPEAADRLLLVGGELLVADRAAGGQARVEALEDHELSIVRLALGRRAVVTLLAQPLDAPICHGEVGEDEFEVEALDVAPRVDRALWVRHGRILERADHVEERIRVAESGEMFGRQFLRSDPALRRRGRRRQVDIRHVGLDDLPGLEDLGEVRETFVGHLHDADVELHPAEAAGVGVAAGQRVEDGRLAGRGKADDGDLHAGQDLRTGREERQYPASGSTTLVSGLPAAYRTRLSQKSSMLRSRTRPLDHAVCGVTMTLGRS